jgi:CheY-like chemotaxis protein
MGRAWLSGSWPAFMCWLWKTPTTPSNCSVLEHVRPHVLVSDVARPNDSIELIREVMTVAQRKGLRIPAIAVTPHRGRRKELMAEGFAELVEKPLDPIELCGTIRRHAQLQT